tara:strand:+ start:1190 stop:2176 length:987 start_codon:yes stop_codon:yes gene_type:complete
VELTQYKKKITDKLRSLAETYLKTEEPLSATERCCVSINHQEFSIACINQHDEVNEIVFLEKIRFDDLESLSLVLKGVAEKHNLAQTPIYWLLNPDEYQLNLIETLPVPKNEFQTALSWRVRSLIDYPVEEAIIEHFELPAKKNSDDIPLIGAVTAKKAQLSDMILLLKDSGLRLVTIDIPELALLNLTSLYETDEKTSAFLYFYGNTVILNISSKKILYFTRRIPVTKKDEAGIDYEKLSLEILRYFDFFRSQWRLSTPSRIFAASDTGDANIIATALTERLLSTVEPYTLNSTIIDTDEKNQVVANYLLDYGCLLRKEPSNASAND